jgi:hypothetical protein
MGGGEFAEWKWKGDWGDTIGGVRDKEASSSPPSHKKKLHQILLNLIMPQIKVREKGQLAWSPVIGQH